MRLALAVLVWSGCGRISFDVLQGVNDASGGDGPITDGPPTDAPADTATVVRACHSDARYLSAAGLANTYREGVPLKSFAAARLDCIVDDADLWVVESSLEQNAFTGDWTGITDEANEDNWVKLDGTAATFLPFVAGEPNGADVENCIRTDPQGFEDRDCNDLRDYVCECPAP